MIYYAVLVEQRYCLHNECRRYAQRSECTHEQSIRWVALNGSLYATIGPAHSEYARLVEAVRDEYHGTDWHTGNAKVMIVDPSTWTPYYNEAEEAALRIGGLDAAKRMRKKRA